MGKQLYSVMEQEFADSSIPEEERGIVEHYTQMSQATALQVTGGLAEIGAGYALCAGSFGLACVPAAGLVALGADEVSTGLITLGQGSPAPTMVERELMSAGMSRSAAAWTTAGVHMAANLGTAGFARLSAQGARQASPQVTLNLFRREGQQAVRYAGRQPLMGAASATGSAAGSQRLGVFSLIRGRTQMFMGTQGLGRSAAARRASTSYFRKQGRRILGSGPRETREVLIGGRRFVERLELHHRFIPNRWRWVPKQIRHHRLNLSKVYSLEHALRDPYRYRFLPRWVKEAIETGSLPGV
jgi:hypothetical protein